MPALPLPPVSLLLYLLLSLRLTLEQGADPQALDNKGHLALDVATGDGCQKLCSAFLGTSASGNGPFTRSLPHMRTPASDSSFLSVSAPATTILSPSRHTISHIPTSEGNSLAGSPAPPAS